MVITLNGEEKQVPDTITIHGLLEFLNIKHQRVAVELNLEIVKKDKYDTTAVKAGDSLEIVSFMSGGCTLRNAPDRNIRGQAPCGVRNKNTEVAEKNLR